MNTYQLDVDSLNIEYKYYSGDGVVAVCEYHNDHHPSMFVNLVEGNYYCFACGARGTIDDLLRTTSGVKKYVPYNLQKQIHNNDEWVKLLSYPLATSDNYLMSRGFNNEIIEKWNIRSDEKRVIIPLTKDDKITGVKVRIKSAKKGVKYLTFGEQPVFMSNFDLDDDTSTVFITEGIFGLMRYEMFGLKAISPLSVNRAVGLKKLIENKKHIYMINFDPDLAGYMGTMKLMYATCAFNNIYGLTQPIDIDCALKEELETIDTLVHGATLNYYLHLIKEQFGESVYKDSVKSFDKFVRTYRG